MGVDGGALSQCREVRLGALTSTNAARTDTTRVVKEQAAYVGFGGLIVNHGSRRLLVRVVAHLVDDLCSKTSIGQHQFADTVNGSLGASTVKVFCDVRLEN